MKAASTQGLTSKYSHLDCPGAQTGSEVKRVEADKQAFLLPAPCPVSGQLYEMKGILLEGFG